MRNLKKVLAMALALVMSLSLVTIANAADFSDDADISYKEAVDVMSAIGVINGYEDGSFQPDGILTREEAAKLICTMLLGDNADQLGTTSSSFTDVAATRWSSPFIEYCNSLGIIAGNGDGTFDPTGELTGHAFAKMLLVALGYDSAREGYTGAGWSIEVAKDAVTAGIDVDGVSLSAEVSREVAAQMALNTLEADMVEYATAGTVVTTPDGTTVVTSGSNASKVEDSRENSTTDYAGRGNDGYTQFCEEYFSKLKKNTKDSDAFERPAYTWNYNAKSVGTYADAADYVVVADKDDENLNYYLDDVNNDFNTAGADPYLNGDSTTYTALLQRGDVIEIFVDDDDADVVDTISIIRYELDQIDAVDEVDNRDYAYNVTFDKNGTYHDDEIEGFVASTYEEDAFIALAVNNGGDILDSYVPESAEGSLTAIASSGAYVRLDGTRYDTVLDSIVSGLSTGSDTVYALYLDKNNYVLGIDEIEGADPTIDDVVYVAAVYKDSESIQGDDVTTFYAQTVAMDGTVGEYVIGVSGPDDDGESVASDNGVATLTTKRLYTIEEDTDGDYDHWNFTAYANSTDDDFDLGSLSSGTAMKSDSTRLGTYYVNGDTQYIMVKGDKSKIDVSVKAGGVNYTTVGGDTAIVLYEKSGSANVAAYIIVAGTNVEVGSEEFSDLLYVESDSYYTDVDDNKVFTVWNAEGEEIEVPIGKNAATPAEGYFYSYEIDEDGVYTLTQQKASIKPTISGGEHDDWDGHYGVAYGLTVESVYEDLLTVGLSNSRELVDIPTDSLAVVDLRDTDEAGQYTRTLGTLTAISSAVENDYTVKIDIALDEDEGAVTIFVVSAMNARGTLEADVDEALSDNNVISKTTADYSMTVTADRVTIRVPEGKTLADVKGTGLVDAAKALVSGGYTVKVDTVTIGPDTDRDALAALVSDIVAEGGTKELKVEVSKGDVSQSYTVSITLPAPAEEE